MAEPFKFDDDIEEALEHAHAERLSGRSSRRGSGFSLPFDPRPSSPSQLALFGIILMVLARFGILLRLSSLGFEIGLLALLVAAVSWMVRPRRRTVMWRERRIDLSPALSWPERLYYVIYRDA